MDKAQVVIYKLFRIPPPHVMHHVPWLVDPLWEAIHYLFFAICAHVSHSMLGSKGFHLVNWMRVANKPHYMATWLMAHKFLKYEGYILYGGARDAEDNDNRVVEVDEGGVHYRC